MEVKRELEYLSECIHNEADPESKARYMTEYNNIVRDITGVDPHYE